MLTQPVRVYNRRMSNSKISPDKWADILAFLRECPDVRVGNEEGCRRFIEAMAWRASAGASWRTLPPEYGNWNSVYKRFVRWSERGVWRLLRDAFPEDPDVDFTAIEGGEG